MTDVMPMDYMRTIAFSITNPCRGGLIMNTDIICFDFFIHNMHFTCEDYGKNTYAVYHEDMFVAEINECDYDKAAAYAVKYYKQCANMGITV